MAKRPSGGTKTRRPRESGFSSSNEPIPLYILSDSTGNLAQHMLTAILTQFPPDRFALYRQNFLQSDMLLQRALEQVAKKPGLVFHAVVSPAAKKMIADHCAKLGLACHDLTGQTVDFLIRESGVQPQPDHSRLHDVSHEYHQRIKALEFTLEHDDGLGVDTIHQADIVLVGVSRTSKTPTSIYLAQQGYRVANVSLALGVEPPRQLMQLTSRNVIGLTIEPHHLVEIRTNRQVQWRMTDTSYNDEDSVAREITWSRRLFASAGWPVLDVTGRAVEETAARIINILNLAGPPTA